MPTINPSPPPLVSLTAALVGRAGRYVCPLLYKGRFVGRLEGKVEGDDLVIKNVWKEETPTKKEEELSTVHDSSSCCCCFQY